MFGELLLGTGGLKDLETAILPDLETGRFGDNKTKRVEDSKKSRLQDLPVDRLYYLDNRILGGTQDSSLPDGDSLTLGHWEDFPRIFMGLSQAFLSNFLRTLY